jgi:hypothetical protein
MHHRTDRHSLPPSEQRTSHLRPTESRLERLINLDSSKQPSSHHGRHFSLTNSQAATRENRTPLGHLATPKQAALLKNGSLTGLQQP